ncbi:MAG TPA: hypothetical protein VGJ20_05745 [Xanthobacteraceae bacterium]
MNLGLNRYNALAALAVSAVLSGCANVDLGSKDAWFQKAPDFFGRNAGYTFSELQESRETRPITANDLVDANGACAAPPETSASPAPPQSAAGAPQPQAAVNPTPPAAANPQAAANPTPPQTAAGAAPPTADNSGAAAGAPEADSLLGGGIALSMSECEVVYRAGTPTSVQLGQNPNGDRTAVLTFNAGPRPGIYRFEGGRLMGMDRVETPAPPVVAKKKAVKPRNQQKKAQL